jgi:DNA polymerase III subunit gamma/tau
MCQLVEFNGTVARVAVKGSKWYETLKSDLPMIKAAFQKTFGYEVQVNLEQVSSVTPTSNRNNPPPKDSTRVQQPPTASYNGQIKPSAPPSQPASPPPAQTPPAFKAESSQRNGNGVNGNGVNGNGANGNSANRNGANGNGANGNRAQSSPPPATKPPTPDWEIDEVAIAAQRLAEFFNGQIIRFADDFPEFSDSITTPEWVEEADVDDE